MFLKVCQTSGFRCVFNFRELALEQELTGQNPQSEQARGSHLQWSRPEPVSSTRAGPRNDLYRIWYKEVTNKRAGLSQRPL